MTRGAALLGVKHARVSDDFADQLVRENGDGETYSHELDGKLDARISIELHLSRLEVDWYCRLPFHGK